MIQHPSSRLDNKQMNIASVILAGGKGTRLFPLTQFHSKPAISYAGRYKLIDIPISNSLNSNIRNIYVIGQYLTSELNHHLAQTFQFDPFFPGMVDLITPEELPTGEKIWFNGTADAVRKSLDKILKSPVDYILILSGDQLYNINFQRMLEFTIENDADLTIASIPVEEEEAKRLGLLKVDGDCFVTDFYEKPQDKAILDDFTLPPSFIEYWKPRNPHAKFLGSMGIYIFKREALEKLLTEDPREDFGKHLIPTEIKRKKTAAFVYEGYWEDIGTIKSYYEANMSLTNPADIRLKMHDEKNPIYTKENYLPGSKVWGTQVNASILCEGGIISASELTRSIVGLRMKIQDNTIIRDSILLGNNYYEAPSHQTHLPEKFEIGKNCLIEKAIIDEHVWIGNNVQLINKDHLDTYDGDGIFIRDGIIVVTAGAHIPNGFIL